MILTTLINLFATADSCNKSGGFFGLIPWWHYLPASDFNGCDIKSFDILSANGLPLILLAVVDDLLRIAGIIAVVYILYGAVLYLTSQGSPDQTQKAQSTLINALVGLGIAIVAVAVVSFVGSKLGG